MSKRYTKQGPGRWKTIERTEPGRNLGVAVAAQAAAAEDPVAVAAQAAAAEDLEDERTLDGSDHGNVTVRSGGTNLFGATSDAGTEGGGSDFESDDDMQHSEQVVRQKDPVYHSSLPDEKVKAWKESKAINGEHVGNIGFLFGNWGRLPKNRRPRTSFDSTEKTARANHGLGRGAKACRQVPASATSCSRRKRSCGCARPTSRVRVFGLSRP